MNMTNEEAILRILEHNMIHQANEPQAVRITEALNMAIKALEQESVLDEIRAEIEQEITYKPIDMWDYRMGLTKALEIIDKHKAESEDTK